MSTFYDAGQDPVANAIQDAVRDHCGTALLTETELRAAANAARDACIRELLAHMDQHAPKDGNTAQLRKRRHMMTAIQVISPKPTAQEVAAMIRQYEPDDEEAAR